MEYLNNYKLYSKINLTLYLYQLHILHMPSVRAIMAWCAHSACLVRTRCARCLFGMQAVLVWYACNAYLVQARCLPGACAVPV